MSEDKKRKRAIHGWKAVSVTCVLSVNKWVRGVRERDETMLERDWETEQERIQSSGSFG